MAGAGAGADVGDADNFAAAVVAVAFDAKKKEQAEEFLRKKKMLQFHPHGGLQSEGRNISFLTKLQVWWKRSSVGRWSRSLRTMTTRDFVDRRTVDDDGWAVAV
jgi:hypothetical protein